MRRAFPGGATGGNRYGQGDGLAVRALRENGHRRIALGMPYPFSSMDARRLSFCSLMKEVYGDRLKEYYIGVYREDMAGDSRILSFWRMRGGRTACS